MYPRSRVGSLALAGVCLLVVIGAASAGSLPGEIAPPLSVQWAHSGGPDPDNTTVPVIDGESVYVTLRGALRALDARTGGAQWEFTPEEGWVSTAPVVSGDLVIVGATNMRLYGINAATGATVWEQTCAATIVPDPIILDDVLYAAAAEMVYAVEPSSGRPIRVCALAFPATYGPVTDGSMLYFLGQDGSIECVDATQGRFRWRVPIMTGPRTFKPVVARRRAIVATGTWVHGVSRSGTVSWTAEMPAAVGGAPTVSGDLLYVPCVDGHIYTIRARSGAPERGVDLSVGYAATAAPLVTDSLVAVGTADGILCTLDKATGRITWMYRCRAPEQDIEEGTEFGIYAPVAGADGSVYCLTGGGDLYRFSASAPDYAGPIFGSFDPEPGAATGGGREVVAAFAAVDDGSGVDPSSLEATIDGMPLAVDFEMATGVGVLQPQLLADGSHIVKVSAKDYRGNVATAEWSFLTSVSIEGEETRQQQTWGAGASRTGRR
jgi:outer membrane protein assembly factor BamB